MHHAIDPQVGSTSIPGDQPTGAPAEATVAGAEEMEEAIGSLSAVDGTGEEE
jgi:hypothetical protein